jgi:hypothetical protein
MTKTNPLFVDSTKLHGDAIGTHVELRNVLVYDGEELFLEVTNHQGVSVKVPMKVGEGPGYESRVHLNHGKPITYRFIIEKEGQLLLQSPLFKGRAQYAIIEDWFPAGLGEPPPLPAEPPLGGETPWAGEYAKSVKSLIDKWGF